MQEIQETGLQSLGQEDPLEKRMATHSSIFAWRIPRTEEPGWDHGVVKSWTHTHQHSLIQEQLTEWPINKILA